MLSCREDVVYLLLDVGSALDVAEAGFRLVCFSAGGVGIGMVSSHPSMDGKALKPIHLEPRCEGLEEIYV